MTTSKAGFTSTADKKFPASRFHLTRDEKRRITEAVAKLRGVTRQRISQLKGKDAEVDALFALMENRLIEKKRRRFLRALPLLERKANRAIDSKPRTKR